MWREIKFWIFYIRLWFAQRKAKKMHKITNKTYYIIPDDKGGIKIVDNTFIKWYNNNRGLRKKITIYELIKMSYMIIN